MFGASRAHYPSDPDVMPALFKRRGYRILLLREVCALQSLPPSRFQLADGLSNGLNLICQFTAANLFTLIICLVRETFSAARKVNSPFSNSPCGYKLLNHTLLVSLFLFFPAQRKRSE